jgi:hypothetical protein
MRVFFLRILICRLALWEIESISSLTCEKYTVTLPGTSEADFPRDLKVSLVLSHEVSCSPLQSLAGGGEQVSISAVTIL